MKSFSREKVILDCDPGMDDSVAIMLAAKSTKIDLLAVTTVSGNYPVDITAKNALKTLELLQISNIPVARGMEHPIVRNRPADPFTHGADGQAEIFLPEPALQLSSTHAVDLIIRLIQMYPHEITIICTGPMTNLAMAITKAPEIIPLIRKVVAISGMFGLNDAAFLNATGDTPQSEWNVYADPEAADIVYKSGINLFAIGLDTATNSSVDFSAEDIEKFRQSELPEARFLYQAISFTHERGFDSYCAVIDCMAVCCAIDPSLMRTKQYHVGIETKDGLTLGMTIRDGRHHFVWTELPLIDIVIDADYSKILEMIKSLILKE